MKHRIPFLIIALITLGPIVATAQTPPPPPPELPASFDTNTVDQVLGILSVTNLYIGAGVRYDTTAHKPFGVVGLAYALDLPVVQDTVMPELRLDTDGHETYGIQGTLTFKPPKSIAGKWPVKPIAEASVATGYNGLGPDNGKLVPIIGTGVQGRIYKTWYGIVGYEWWFYGSGGATPATRGTHNNFVFVLSKSL